MHAKHLPGRHNQENHADGGVPGVAAAVDKLKLAARIQLQPGERLMGSDYVAPNHGDSEAAFARVDMSSGSQMRFGVVARGDRRKWAAADRGGTVRFDDGDIAGLATELGQISATAKHAQSDFRTMSVRLEDDGLWDVPDEDLTPEQRERLDRYGELRDEGVFDSGVIPGSAWGDLHWAVVGSDSTEIAGEEVVSVQMTVRPSADRGRAMSSFEGSDRDRFLELELTEINSLHRKVSKLAEPPAGQPPSTGKSTRSSSMQTKSFQPHIKSASQGKATFRIARFDEVDKDGDVTLPGFFGQQHAQMVPAHDWNHVPIGKALIYEDAEGGLADVKFNLAIPEAKAWYDAIVFDLANPPALQQHSYGYEVLEGGSKRGDFKGRQVRFLTPRPDGTAGVKVFEVSPVLQGAGVDTHTVSVKSRTRSRGGAVPSTISPAIKRAIPSHETGTVSRTWDTKSTTDALPADARPSQLRTVYAWVDPDGDPEAKSSYRFAHHHGVDGPANLRACVIGIAALNNGTVDLPETDVKGIYEHLAAHMRDADREPPELRTDSGSKNLRFADEAAQVLAAVSGLIDRASDVMALRARKSKGMAAANADLLSWIDDDIKRLKSLLSHPIEDDTQPSDEEIASVLLRSVAQLHDL